MISGVTSFDPIMNQKTLMLLATGCQCVAWSNSTELSDLRYGFHWFKSYFFTFLRFSYIGPAGDIGSRLCTVAEVKFYFNNLFEASQSSNYLKPNKNCNLTTWVSGCEPGWACSLGANELVDLRKATDIPARTKSCDTCCEGFFCPHGLTCMIRKCYIIWDLY